MTKTKAKAKARASKAAAGDSGGDDLRMLRELIGLLEVSTATSLKLKRGGATYEVSRAATASPAGVVHVAAAPAASPAAPAAAAAPPAQPPPANLIEIKSPMVGTFYRAPEPGAEPYVKGGARIAPGQTLCIIEAMKIMNELESEVSGTIREILVDDAQPVEFGQVLFRVEPNV
jgi:acetyl-CoA carboxylase biotin carboxyl carrier protein